MDFGHRCKHKFKIFLDKNSPMVNQYYGRYRKEEHGFRIKPIFYFNKFENDFCLFLNKKNSLGVRVKVTSGIKRTRIEGFSIS